jgi:hypothetical protein
VTLARCLATFLAVLGVAWGCATTGQLSGASGPVAWEVVDVREQMLRDGQEIRWSYTLVLNETRGTGIQFDDVRSQATGPRADHAWEWKLSRRLGPRASIRIDSHYGIYYGSTSGATFGYSTPGGREGVTVVHRLSGKDDTGQPVQVEVRFPLYPGIGK